MIKKSGDRISINHISNQPTTSKSGNGFVNSNEYTGAIPECLKSCLKMLLNPIFLEDQENHIIGFNRAFEELLNGKGQQILGQKSVQLISNYQAVIRESNHALIKQPNHIFRKNIRIEIGAGETRDVLLCRSAFRAETNGAEGYINSLTDLTLLKKYEAEAHQKIQIEQTFSRLSTRFINIKEAEVDELIQNTLQTIGEFQKLDTAVILLFSADQNYLTLSHAWRSAQPASDKPIYTDQPAAPFHWSVSKLKQARPILINRLSDLPKSAAAECTILKRFDVKSAILTPLISENNLIGIAAFTTKVSEQKWQAEDVNLFMTVANLIASGIQRIRSVKERDNIQAQLIHSQRMEDIGNLAGGIAHDFNNILTVIQGRVQMLMMNTDPGDSRLKDMKQICEVINRAADLARQLLLFSRKHEVNLKVININLIIENTYQMLKHLVRENITFETHLEPHLWKVHADESNIEQILLNLVVNAQDAIHDKGHIIIRTENVLLNQKDIKIIPESRSGNFIRLSVEDSGCGIKKEIINHIFDPFFSTKEKDQGTGLGLSVVYGIVKKHGGWVNLYSEIDHGTVFKIYLPAIISEKSQLGATEIELIENYRGNQEVVLIVEDNIDVLQTLDELLQSANYHVLKAASGEVALEIFRKHPDAVDIVISDILLPGINGKEMVNQMLSRYPELKVIFMSGYSPNRFNLSATDLEHAVFIQKPIQSQTLLNTIRRMLDQP